MTITTINNPHTEGGGSDNKNFSLSALLRKSPKNCFIFRDKITNRTIGRYLSLDFKFLIWKDKDTLRRDDIPEQDSILSINRQIRIMNKKLVQLNRKLDKIRLQIKEKQKERKRLQSAISLIHFRQRKKENAIQI